VDGNNNVGGLVGNAQGKIFNSYNTGKVNGNSNVGGITGYISNGGTVTNCYNSGTVIGTGNAGGIAGNVNGTATTIANVYNTGNISGANNVGGVAGELSGKLYNSYNVGYVSGSNNGGVVGSVSSGTVSGSYYFAVTASSGIGTGGSAPLPDTFDKYGTLTSGPQTNNSLIYVLNNWAMAKPPAVPAPAGVDYLQWKGLPFPEFTADDLRGIWDGTTIATEFAGGDGSEGDPYQISNGPQLAYLAKVINANTADTSNPHTGLYFNSSTKHYILTDHIILNNTSDWTSWDKNKTGLKKWTPIGDNNEDSTNHRFAAKFDGNRFAVYGIFISNITTNDGYLGLFGFISGGEVKNVGVEQSYIYGSYNVGGVAGGISANGILSNCYNTGNVDANGNTAGGVIGLVAANGTIMNCYNTGNINIGCNYAGGVVGRTESNGKILNCYNTGKIYGGNIAVGGIVGSVPAGGMVLNCYNTGSVTGGASGIGSIAGYVYNSTVSYSYFLAGSSVKGAVGAIETGGTLTSTGVGSFGTDGKFISPSTIKVGSAAATDTLLTALNDWVLSPPSLGKDAMFSGWYNAVYPMLNYNPQIGGGGDVWDGTAALGFAGGDGSKGDPYQIANGNQLTYLAHVINNNVSDTVFPNTGTMFNSVTKHYILTKNIVLNSTSNWSNWGTNGPSTSNSWTPIGDNRTGNANSQFAANFDGNGFSLFGIYIPGTAANDRGLFGYVNGGTVENVGIEQSYISGNVNIGGVAGQVYNGTVSDCYNNGKVYAASNAGGVAGSVSGSTISNSYNTGTVNTGGNNSGGVAGSASNTMIFNSYNTGSVTASGSNSGGVAGSISTTSKLYNCYNAGGVTGTNAGGIAGSVNNSTVSNCYNNGNVTGTNAGGVAGYVSGSTISDSYYRDNSSVGIGSPSGNTGTTRFSINGNVGTFTDGKKVTISPYPETSDLMTALNCWIKVNDADVYSGYEAAASGSGILLRFVPTSGDLIISGVVTNTLGEPLENVIILYTIGTSAGPQIATDPNGKYAIITSASETITILNFQKFGYRYTGSPITYTTTNTSADHVLQYNTWESFKLSGTVTQGGNPISGAEMRYTINGGAVQYVSTTASGYSISAPSGSTIMINGIVGFNAVPSLPMSFVMTDNKTQNFTVTSGGTFTLSGSITHNGSPVIGAEIMYTINGGIVQTFLTTAAGYSISAPAGSTVLITGIKGYIIVTPSVLSFVMANNIIQSITVMPDETSMFTLSGSMTQDSSPVIGAQIRYTINGGTAQFVMTTAGGYSISALSGSTVVITGVTGYNIMSPTNLTFVMMNNIIQPITIAPDGYTMFTLSGTVKNASGDAVAGATMKYSVNGGPEQTVLITASGYSISVLVGSTVRITEIVGYIAVPSLPMDFVMTYHKTQDFTVTPSDVITFTLSGTVTHNGNPVAGAEVKYRINGGAEQSVLTSESGYYISAPSGSFVTITGIKGYTILTPPSLSFVMTNNIVQNITVIPDGTTIFTLSGTVTQSGNPVIGAQLRYTINGGPEQTMLTTADGYSISALSGSTVVITGVTGYNIQTPTNLTFAMTNDIIQPITVTPDGTTMFTLSGTVKDAAGNPVIGAAIDCMVSADLYRTIWTDVNGYSISVPSGSKVTIIEITGYNVTPSLPMSFIMTSDNTQDFTVVPDGTTMFTLSGTVKDADGNAVVGATMRYSIGTTSYTLKTDANGYSISALVGSAVTIIEMVACETVPALPLEFILTNDMKQNFIVISSVKYTLTSSSSQPSWGHIEYYDGIDWMLLPGSMQFFGGDTVSLRAVAVTGYGFSYWSGSLNGTDDGSADPVTLLMDSDKTIGAVFYDTAPGMSYALTADPFMFNGMILWSVDGTIPFQLKTVIFPVDTAVELKAVGDPNVDPLRSPWMFSYWTGALGGNKNPENITMNADHTVGAVFYDSSDPSQYFRLYLDGETHNGKVIWSVNSGIPALLTAEGVIFPVGTDVELEAIANEGFKFSHWTDAREDPANLNTRTHRMNDDLGVNAAFIENTNKASFGIMVWVAILLVSMLALLLVFLLSYIKYRVTGTVTYHGNGLEGVTLEYIMNGKAGTTSTDDSGRYAIRAFAGSEVIISDVRARGYSVLGAMPKELLTEKTTRDVNFMMEKL
jgi:hypothetical protein